jgi:SAM-dependent methyltransferase
MAKASNLLYSKLLTFRLGHFERLPENLRGRFDLVVCLANSISGTGSHANLHRALKGFYSVLQPDGSLVLQMLNYSAIKEGEIVPVRATQGGSIIYERFTERRARRLYLYVTRLNLKCKPPQLEVFRQEMDNFDLSEIVTGLKKAGFINIKRYADLYLSARFTRFSRDLVITARKAVR